jgi:isopropylmalate/homocitrate/citramalate synthase
MRPNTRRRKKASAAVMVVDCTLREGEQTPGVVFSRSDKLHLATALAEAGFQEVEIGMPAVSPNDAETCRAIVKLGLPFKCFVVCMATKDDIDRARDIGVDGVSISLPASRVQIEHKLKWSYDRVVETAVELSAYAHEQGLLVTVSPYDTTRANRGFLKRYITEVQSRGHMDRLRLVDTVGCATPELTAALVIQMLRWTGHNVPIEMHCHDDFGLATANTLTGVMAGADVVSTTINGTGERAGGAATEQVVAGLELLYEMHTGIHLDRLQGLCRLVEQLSGIVLAERRPIVGRETFNLESGTIVAGYLNQELAAFPFSPAIVGGQVRIIFGKKTGRKAVMARVSELGIAPLTDEALDRVLNLIKTHAEADGKAVPDPLVQEWLRNEARAG